MKILGVCNSIREYGLSVQKEDALEYTLPTFWDPNLNLVITLVLSYINVSFFLPSSNPILILFPSFICSFQNS